MLLKGSLRFQLVGYEKVVVPAASLRRAQQIRAEIRDIACAVDRRVCILSGRLPAEGFSYRVSCSQCFPAKLQSIHPNVCDMVQFWTSTLSRSCYKLPSNRTGSIAIEAFRFVEVVNPILSRFSILGKVEASRLKP